GRGGHAHDRLVEGDGAGGAEEVGARPVAEDAAVAGDEPVARRRLRRGRRRRGNGGHQAGQAGEEGDRQGRADTAATTGSTTKEPGHANVLRHRGVEYQSAGGAPAPFGTHDLTRRDAGSQRQELDVTRVPGVIKEKAASVPGR